MKFIQRNSACVFCCETQALFFVIYGSAVQTMRLCEEAKRLRPPWGGAAAQPVLFLGIIEKEACQALKSEGILRKYANFRKKLKKMNGNA